jgi:type IV pilus assembly protein PilQ
MKAFRPALLALLLVSGFMSGANAGQIDSVVSKTLAKEIAIEIVGDGLTNLTKEEKKSPPQLVLTFKDATLAEEAKQSFDPSTENDRSPLIQVSSYPYSDSDARVVLDFKSGLNYKIEKSPKKITIHMPLPSEKVISTAEKTNLAPLTAADKDPLTTIMSAESEQKFTGSPITLKLKDADVHEVLRLISDTSGFNIVIHPSVSGKLTISLDQVPWDQALDVVLTTLRLAAERKDSVLRVLPRDMLIQEKQAELDAKKVVAQAAPRITRIFPISYADLGSISGILTNFSNSQNSNPGSSGIPTTIIQDSNTQSLIIRDTAESIERMRKMIELLDVQTPQVIIEAKVIDATNSFTKTIGGKVGFQIDGRNNIGINGGVSNAGGSPVTNGNSNNFRFGIGNSLTLDAILGFSEGQNRAKVVSSPRVMVLSGKSATITQGSNILSSTTTTTTAGPQVTQSFVPYSTSLNVTPRVTNDGSVFMRLSLSRDTVETIKDTSVTAPRNMTTEVIVDSGSTLVLGGIQNMDESGGENGFPILRKMPIIGWLFGDETDNNKKTELMFFVTPRILNQKKASIGSEGVQTPTAAENSTAPKTGNL